MLPFMRGPLKSMKHSKKYNKRQLVFMKHVFLGFSEARHVCHTPGVSPRRILPGGREGRVCWKHFSPDPGGPSSGGGPRTGRVSVDRELARMPTPGWVPGRPSGGGPGTLCCNKPSGATGPGQRPSTRGGRFCPSPGAPGNVWRRPGLSRRGKGVLPTAAGWRRPGEPLPHTTVLRPQTQERLW